jgi:hypothetical protein
MLEFLKKTPQKEVAMISKRYRRATDYGKKTVILSCEPCPNGDIASDNKWTCFQDLLKSAIRGVTCRLDGDSAALACDNLSP